MARSGPEARLQRKIRAAVVRHATQQDEEIYIVKNHGGPHSVPGVADFTCCYRGRYVALEVKVPPNGPTEKQRHHLRLVRRAGGRSAVVTSSDEAVRVLKKIDKEAG